MSAAPDFAVLMERLRGGDQDAARAIFERFSARLIAVARDRLGARLGHKVDAEDITQSAFRSFFVRQAAGQFDLCDWDSLWALLTTITLRKCGHKVEHFRAACRDVRREVARSQQDEDDSAASWQAIAREPTPAEAAQFSETVEALFAGLDEGDRLLVEMSLQGHSTADISAQTNISERTVYRRLERIKARLERLRASD